MGAIYGLTKNFVFKQAVKFLLSKRVLPLEEYKLLHNDCKATAFTVSGYSSLVILQEFLNDLTAAIADGQTMQQFRQNINSFLVDKGYKGINPFRADVIFRTNIQTAFNAGHYESMTAARSYRPYWMYKTVGDGNERDSHLVMAGRVYAADDPIWDLWYPPNGYRCRCIVVSLTKQQIERKGLRIETQPPYIVDYSTGEVIHYTPDKGFSSNPAKVDYKPDLSNLSKPLRRIYDDAIANKTG